MVGTDVRQAFSQLAPKSFLILRQPGLRPRLEVVMSQPITEPALINSSQTADGSLILYSYNCYLLGLAGLAHGTEAELGM